MVEIPCAKVQGIKGYPKPSTLNRMWFIGPFARGSQRYDLRRDEEVRVAARSYSVGTGDLCFWCLTLRPQAQNPQALNRHKVEGLGFKPFKQSFSAFVFRHRGFTTPSMPSPGVQRDREIAARLNRFLRFLTVRGL